MLCDLSQQEKKSNKNSSLHGATTTYTTYYERQTQPYPLVSLRKLKRGFGGP